MNTTNNNILSFQSYTQLTFGFILLFTLGFSTSYLFQHLQYQYHILNLPNTSETPSIHSFLFLHLEFGLLACICGFLYPFLDQLFKTETQLKASDWSSVMRCAGGLIGVNYAASKLSIVSSAQVSLVLALIAIGLWFLFDFTKHGFFISLLVTFIGTLTLLFWTYQGIYSFTKADFFGVRSYIPCVLYASCIWYGSIGRQLFGTFKMKQA